MSNPVPPSGLPVPPPQEPVNKDDQEKSLPEEVTLPSPQPGLRDSSSPEAAIPDTDVLSRSVTPVASDAEKREQLRKIDKLLKTGNAPPVLLLTKVLLLHDLFEFNEAHSCLDGLLENLPQDHPIYALACFWRGSLLVREDRWVTPASMKWFEQALQHGMPSAIPFVMAGYTGLYGKYSQVKWRNCKAVMDLLMGFVGWDNPFQTNLNRYLAHLKKNEPLDLMAQCCNSVQHSAGNILDGYRNTQSPLGFTSLSLPCVQSA